MLRARRVALRGSDDGGAGKGSPRLLLHYGYHLLIDCTRTLCDPSPVIRVVHEALLVSLVRRSADGHGPKHIGRPYEGSTACAVLYKIDAQSLPVSTGGNCA